MCLNLPPLMVSYKLRAGQRKTPVAASRMAGGQFHIPMLPPELSEGITSLNENEERAAIVIDKNGTVVHGTMISSGGGKLF